MSYLRSIVRRLLGDTNGERRRPARRQPYTPRNGARPAIEQLESRELLSGLTVSILGSPTSGHSPEGKALYLTSALSGTTPGVAYSYSWQVLKNNAAFASSSSSALLFRPDDDGTYQVTLNVHDKFGHAATASQAVTADDVAPKVFLPGRFGTAMVAVPFHASATSPSSVDSAAGFSYSWNFGDGTTGSGPSPSHTYTSPGKYTVTVTVTDSGGGLSTTASTTASIARPPAPTVAITGWPIYGSCPEGMDLTLNSVLRGTTPGVTYTEAWQVWKGSASFASSTAGSIQFTPDDAAPYRVSLTVTDQFGTTVTRNLGLTVYDRPPAVQLPALFAVDIGSPVNFSAAVTDGPLDTAAGLRYVWSFGDGTSSSDVAPSHTYAKTGTYAVKLTVANDDGLNTTATARARIAPPVSAHLSAPSSVSAGTTNAYVKFTNQAGGTGGYTYSYDFNNDGTFEVTGSTSPAVIIPESYLDYGPATLTVRGRIADGAGSSHDYTATIHITDAPPTPSITLTPDVDTGQAVTFEGTATDPSTAITNAGFTYSWNFGDGSTGNGASPSHSYAKPGRYAVTLTATDENGGTGSISRTITVTPLPTAKFSGPASVDEGTTTAQVTFTNQAGGSGGYTYSYDFNNDGTFEIVRSKSAQWTVPASDLTTDGPHVVHARITDSAGGSTDYRFTIYVNAVASST